MPKTKKLLAALTKDGKPSTRTEFLIPSKDIELPFRTIKKGKLHEVGYVVLIGKEISEQDFIDRIGFPMNSSNEMLSIIQDYFEQIKNFKVGNIVTASFQESDKLLLKFVAKSWRGINKNER